MPDGFLGKPAFTYLSLVEEIHAMAVSIISQSPASAPIEPRIIRLPYTSSDANIGSYSLGYGNSGNIVANQGKYYDTSFEAYRIDDDLGRFIYSVTREIDIMCQTIFKMPTAVPRILDISNEIRTSLDEFIILTDDTTKHIRRYADDMAVVGGNGSADFTTFIWNESGAEHVRARSEAALREQADELRHASTKFQIRADELIEEAERIEARLPIQKAITHIVWREYRDDEGNEQSYQDSETEWVTDHPATAEARAQAQALREEARALRRVALEFVRVANHLTDAIATTNHKFHQMHQEAIAIDTRSASTMDYFKQGMEAFTRRMQGIRDSFSMSSTTSPELMDAKFDAKSSKHVNLDFFTDTWNMIHGTKPLPTGFKVSNGVTHSTAPWALGLGVGNPMKTGYVSISTHTSTGLSQETASQVGNTLDMSLAIQQFGAWNTAMVKASFMQNAQMSAIGTSNQQNISGGSVNSQFNHTAINGISAGSLMSNHTSPWGSVMTSNEGLNTGSVLSANMTQFDFSRIPQHSRASFTARYHNAHSPNGVSVGAILGISSSAATALFAQSAFASRNAGHPSAFAHSLKSSKSASLGALAQSQLVIAMQNRSLEERLRSASTSEERWAAIKDVLSRPANEITDADFAHLAHFFITLNTIEEQQRFLNYLADPVEMTSPIVGNPSGYGVFTVCPAKVEGIQRPIAVGVELMLVWQFQLIEDGRGDSRDFRNFTQQRHHSMEAFALLSVAGQIANTTSESWSGVQGQTTQRTILADRDSQGPFTLTAREAVDTNGEIVSNGVAVSIQHGILSTQSTGDTATLLVERVNNLGRAGNNEIHISPLLLPAEAQAAISNRESEALHFQHQFHMGTYATSQITDKIISVASAAAFAATIKLTLPLAGVSTGVSAHVGAVGVPSILYSLEIMDKVNAEQARIERSRREIDRMLDANSLGIYVQNFALDTIIISENGRDPQVLNWTTHNTYASVRAFNTITRENFTWHDFTQDMFYHFERFSHTSFERNRTEFERIILENRQMNLSPLPSHENTSHSNIQTTPPPYLDDEQPPSMY
ncbi:MAG: hypothetical protein FWE05_13690 [Defluviitaleaceae bacterium]|nr:hypothetical protein [Defluviitaleaceae bacterium]